jgi:hypothetical protein
VDVRLRARADTAKKMYWSDLGDIVLVILLSPVVYVFVTRAPAFAAVVFSSLLISG